MEESERECLDRGAKKENLLGAIFMAGAWCQQGKFCVRSTVLECEE